MTKVIGMLVALAMFAAVPGIAFAGEGGDTGTSGDAVNNNNSGGGGGTGGTGGTGETGETGELPGEGEGEEEGGDNVNCQIAQSAGAGGDVSQEATNNCGNTNVDGGGEGGDNVSVGGDDDNVGGGDVTGVGGGDVGGGGVGGVTLARTGFDAWLLALLGGLSLAGGLGLLVAQRRGRIGA